MKEALSRELDGVPFVPHPTFRNGHVQTIVGKLLPRRTPRLNAASKPRYFDPSPGVRLLAHCSWQRDRRSSPTLLLTHGLEGSAASHYMMGTAEKALAAGFNVIRLNHRNCGGTAHLTHEIYHAGLTDDVRNVLAELAAVDKLTEIYLVGFSLGGNQVLKLAGELGNDAPGWLSGVVAVSPSLHLSSCADAIDTPANFLYQMSFVLSLRKSVRDKARLFPHLYDTARLRGVWSIRRFDDTYVAPAFGFDGASDYYERASAFPYVARIAVPTLIINAKDDPFIPFAPFERHEIRSNPNVVLLATENGGHVGFVSAAEDKDERFWAEGTIVRFASAVHSLSRHRANGTWA